MGPSCMQAAYRATSGSMHRRQESVRIDLKAILSTPNLSNNPRPTHFVRSEQPAAGKQVVVVESLDHLAYHICLVSMAMGIAVIVKVGASELEGLFNKPATIVKGFPLFPFCLLSSVLMQILLERFDGPVDRPTIERILNTAQDGMVVVGMGLLSFKALIAQGGAFVLTSTAAFLWSGLSFFFLARWMLKDYWVERALVELGVALGSTATALLLLRMADPEQRTPVFKQFGFKQIIHVMIVGGGAFDACALLIVDAGIWVLLACSVCGFVICTGLGAINQRCA